ncbi:MAG: HD domain-containing phosphohydrolase [Myxococcota bacterium]
MAGGAGSQGAGRPLLERLRDSGVVDADGFRAVLIEARRMREHAFESLLRVGERDEATLLRDAAAALKTKFITTEKLSRADVRAEVVRMIPRRVCTRLHCFPVLFRPRTQTLLVVTSDPVAYDVERELQAITTIRKIEVLIARPAAIDAAIALHYDGKKKAFADLVPKAPGARGLAGGGFAGGGFAGSYGGSDFGELGGGFSGGLALAGGASAAAPPTQAAAPMAITGDDIPGLDAIPSGNLRIEAPEVLAGLNDQSKTPRSPSSPPEAEDDGQDFLDLTHVFVALLERDRGELRDHSAEVARLCRAMVDRLGVAKARGAAIVLAGYLHDVGKTSSYHLTPFNVSRYEGHKTQAKKTYLSPLRLFASANLPEATEKALQHLYERFDGKGFPDGTSAKEIPLGARIVAIAETFADLTSHEKNPYRRRLSPKEAFGALRGLAGEVFDPELVELLRQVVQGAEQDSRARKTVLLVDPDPDETTILDIRLSAAGFQVLVARSQSAALARIDETHVDALVAEVDLEDGNGFSILESLRESGRTLPALFLTRRSDRSSVERGFQLGAVDYLVKPASPEVVVAKMTQVLASASRGIAGSLSDMSLPDVLQIVGNSRKTGRLMLASGGRAGDVHISDGQVWDARFGRERGVEAFYRLLLLQEGDFQFDTSFAPTSRLITDALESLLLEGMRRMDEGARA